MGQATILVVEDDVDTREMIGRFLELEGFSVQLAANGRQALDRLMGGLPACVILLDLMMPVMDGWEFRRQQIQEARLAQIPVIVVSAAGYEELDRIRPNDHLTKPVDLDELLQRVTHYCRLS